MDVDKQEILNNPATNFLVFDPSKRYTGWILYKPEMHKIINYGCIRSEVLLKGQEFTKVMEQREAFQKAFSWELMKIMRLLDPEYTHVIMEKPIGSQSAKAAWALAMASQGVTTSTICMLRKEPITYKERDAKMNMFHRASVSKGETKKVMWAYWRGQSIDNPEDKWRSETTTERRKMMEACADAMLLLNLHLHKLSK